MATKIIPTTPDREIVNSRVFDLPIEPVWASKTVGHTLPPVGRQYIANSGKQS